MYVRVYEGWLKRRPLLTKVATGFGTAVLGDLACQTLMGDGIDQRRVAGFAAYGAVISGGFQHFWYGWLEARYPMTSMVHWPTVAKKVFLQQAIMVPIVYYPAFYLIGGVVRQMPADAVLKQIREEHWDVQRTNWLFWLPVQTLQFAFVPHRHHVLYACTMSVLFNSILSFLSNRGLERQRQKNRGTKTSSEDTPASAAGDCETAPPIAQRGAGG